MISCIEGMIIGYWLYANDFSLEKFTDEENPIFGKGNNRLQIEDGIKRAQMGCALYATETFEETMRRMKS